MMPSKSEKTLAKILGAAENLFVQRNFADVTMDQIAKKAEVTKGGLYHHFASKEILYLTMMHQDLLSKQAIFARAINVDSDAKDRLRRLTASFFKLPKIKRDLIRLVRRDINIFSEPFRSELIRAYQATLPQQVEEIIAQGAKRGEIIQSNPRLLSWYFISIVECTLTPYADKVFGAIDKKLDYVLTLFFAGASKVNLPLEPAGRECL